MALPHWIVNCLDITAAPEIDAFLSEISRKTIATSQGRFIDFDNITFYDAYTLMVYIGQRDCKHNNKDLLIPPFFNQIFPGIDMNAKLGEVDIIPNDVRMINGNTYISMRPHLKERLVGFTVVGSYLEGSEVSALDISRHLLLEYMPITLEDTDTTYIPHQMD